MGNTPSKESPGRPSHKLSKPKVTSFQPPAPSTTSSSQPSGSGPKRPSESVQEFLSIPYSTTSSNSNAGTDDAEEDQKGSDKSTPLVAPKAQRRLSLFRSKSSQEPPDRRKSRRNTIIGSPTQPSERDFASVVRANSVSTHPIAEQSHDGHLTKENWPVAGSRASWAYDLSSYEAQRVLSLVQDRPKPLSRSQTLGPLSGAGLDDRPRRRASMFVQPQSAPISRSNSELSLHPPMRRRSLIQTPGVATRPQPGPATARSTRSSLRHSHPPTPNLSRQPSTHFEEPDSAFLPLPPFATSFGANSELCRVATPKDTDYSITGAFKFGTLRITNGSPVLSPNPTLSHESDFKPAASDRNNEDYVAREMNGGETVVQRGVNADPTLASLHLEPMPQVHDAKAPEKSSSNLKAVREEPLPGLSITNPEMDCGGQCATDVEVSLDDTLKRYAAPASPLMTQSRQAAVDADLFADDTEVPVTEVLDVRVDLSARSFPRQKNDSTQDSDGVDRSDSGSVLKAQSNSSQSHGSLAKADSGYSSNVSLRSLRHGRKLATSEEEAGRTSTDSDRGSRSIQRNGSQRVLEIQVPAPAAVNDGQTVDTPQSDKAPTPPPKDDFLLKNVSPNASGVKDVRATPTTLGRTRRKPLHQQPPAIDTSQTLESQELRPKPLPLSPASANSEGSSSSLSIANSSQKPGRLQRLLSLRNSPFSKQPYTVHETHSVDRKIPSIPKEVEAKLRERTGLYPMTTKRLALKSQMSKETLKTILSVGSLEYANDDDLTPAPTFLGHDDGEQGNTFESGGLIKTAAASVVSSKKPIARKPVPVREPQKREEEDHMGKEDMLPVEMESTNYLSASTSLSSGSYDSAICTLSPSTRPRRSLSMTTGYDHYLRMRTYTLDSRPSSVPVQITRASNVPEDGQIPPKRKTSPPISMVTRSSFRTPPPRSPSRPQGPAVRRNENQETLSTSVSYSAVPITGQRLGHRASISGGQPAKSVSASQLHVSTWDAPSRHSSLKSQISSTVHSRHNSISSVRSEFVRESRGLQMYDQHNSGAALKPQSSLETIGRNQIYGVYVPQSTHQGPTLVPQPQFSNPHGHWNPQNGRSMSGQLPWGAPPYVPRGHHRRNHSGSSQANSYAQLGGHHAPYRILHSYNSPAYRNAPIWG